MKRFITLIVAAIAAFTLTSYGWTRTYGGSDYDGGYCVQQTNDGDYIIIGFRDGGDKGRGGALWLLKTDEQGDTLWTRIYGGGISNMTGYYVDQTLDSGYILTGTKAGDLWLLKTDKQGDTLWSRTYGGMGYVVVERGYCVQQTYDSGYVIAGYSYSSGYVDGLLLKTNEGGDSLWMHIYDRTTCMSVKQIKDSNYIVTGRASNGYGPLWLFKVDGDGHTLWSHTYGAQSQGNDGFCVQETNDSGYIVTGWRNMIEAGGLWYGALWLLKTDANGDTLWTRTYSKTTYLDYGSSVQQTLDGGYIITGVTDYETRECGDLWLLKTNAEGDTLWTRIYGGVDIDCGYSVEQTLEGGYIVTGYTESFGAGKSDLWLLKTNANGDTLWYEVSATTIIEPQEGDTIDRMMPSAYFTHLGTKSTENFYCYCEITAEGYHTADYLDSVLVSESFTQGDSVLIEFKDWICDDSSQYEARFYTTKESEPIWQTREKSVTFYGSPWSGVLEEEPANLTPYWELTSSCGSKITLRYTNYPEGFSADIFDAMGRKVDELKSVDASGTITWGDTAPTGIYFIRISPGARSDMRKVILLR